MDDVATAVSVASKVAVPEWEDAFFFFFWKNALLLSDALYHTHLSLRFRELSMTSNPANAAAVLV